MQKKNTLPALHVHIARKEKTAELNVLYTEDGLGGLLGRKDHYAIDIVFPLVASFMNKSIGLKRALTCPEGVCSTLLL